MNQKEKNSVNCRRRKKEKKTRRQHKIQEDDMEFGRKVYI